MRVKLIACIAGALALTSFAAFRVGEYRGEAAGRAAASASFEWLGFETDRPREAAVRDGAQSFTAAGPETGEGTNAAVMPPSSTAVHAAALQVETPAELLAVETEFAQAYATYALAARADQAAIEALIRDAQAISGPDDRVHITSAFFSRYVEIDATAALDFLRDERLEPKRDYLSHIFASWTFADPEAAIAAASTVTAGADRMAANQGIMRVYDDQGAAKLAEIGRRLTIGGRSPAMDPLAVVSLAQTDPLAALDQVERLPMDLRSNVAMAVGAAWAARDPEAAYRNVSSRPVDPMKQPLLSGIFAQWVATAPERVIEVLDNGVSADEQRAIVSYGITRLARARPKAAFELVSAMDNSGARDAALRVSLQQWAQQDASAAVAALETLDKSTGQTHALIVGREYARAAPERALEWAQRYDEGYGTTWNFVLSEVANQDAQRGLDFASRVPQEQRATAFYTVINVVAQADPAAAAQYWGRLPAEARTNGAVQIAQQWIQRDAAAAEAWVLALPRGAERDAGLTALLVDDGIDLRDAPRLVNAIDAEQERGAAAERVMRRALRTGTALDAELVLNRMQLSPESRAQAQRILDRGSSAPRAVP